MRKRLLAILLALTLVVSLMPVGAMAVEGLDGGDATQPQTTSSVSTASDSPVQITKSVTKNDDGNYTLTMEAYVTGNTTTTVSGQALDIVLVLDQSGSMYSGGRLAALETAVQNFVNAINNDAEQKDLEHRIAVVGYASNRNDGRSDDGTINGSHDRYVNTGVYVDNEFVNYSQSTETSEQEVEVYNPETGWFAPEYYIYVNGQAKTVNYSDYEEGWYYTEQGNRPWETTRVYVTPKTSENDNEEGHYQFYTIEYSSEIVYPSEYSGAFYSLTKGNSDDYSTLSYVVSNLAASGATRTSLGMSLAQIVFDMDADKEERSDAERVVVVFSDGEPGSSGFSYNEANSAIDTAREIKDDYNATIYTIGFGINDSDSRNFMDYLSSNYPNASAMNNYGSRVSYEEDYSFDAVDADDLNEIFTSITDQVTTASVNADEGSTLTDTLSEYFDFPVDFDSQDDVTAHVEEWNGSGWSIVNDNVSVQVSRDGDTLSISGYDYSEYPVTENSGRKLVISFPIEIDKGAILGDNTIKNDIYPTNNTSNSKAGLTYTVGEDENASTLLDESPEVYVDKSKLDANGTDVTVQVFVDGSDEPYEAPLSLIELSRNYGRDAKDKYFNAVANGNTVVCDFDYDDEAENGGHDCVDIDVSLKANSTYIIQGVEYREDYGSGDPKGVTLNDDGSITIDNVTAGSSDEDPDVIIYLRTKYEVEYYKDGTLLDGAYTDNNTYIAGEDITADDVVDNDPTEDNPAVIKWKNTGCLTSITVQSLPENTEGWTVGTSTTTVDSDSVTVDSVDEYADSSNVIKFNSTTKQDVRYTVEYYFDDAKAEDLTETGSGEIGTQINNYEDKADQAPDGQNYVLDRVENLPLTLDEDATQNVIEVYYALDENEDEIPDKYQAFVNYIIVNGTWTGGGTIISQVYNFYEKVDGEWVEKETAPTLDDVPTEADAVAEDGYSKPGTWTDSTPTAGSELTMGMSYTYTYTLPGVTPTITVSVTHGTAEYGSDVKLTISSDTDEPNTASFTVTYGSDSTITFNAQNGYALDYVKVNGSYVVVTRDNFGTYTFSNVTEDQSIAVVYAADGNGDGTPDIHQATVTYKIVNGTWSDGKIDDIVYTVDVEEYLTTGDNAGTWVETGNTVSDAGDIPSGMKPNDNYVEPGQWDKNPDDNLVVPKEGLVYTYSYTTEKNQQYEITKVLTSAKRGETTYTGESLKTYKARVGDVLTYTIKVENTGNVPLSFDLTDTFTGAEKLNFGEVAADAGYSVEDNDDGTYTITINSLAPEKTLEITATYTVTADDIEMTDADGDGKLDAATITNTLSWGDGDDEQEDEEIVTVDEYTVEITVADMLIYTGGEAYGGIIDASGNLVTDADVNDGLPEPGYHIVLSDAVVQWLNDNDIEAGDGSTTEATRLENVLHFTYNVGDTERYWELSYVGVYSTNDDGTPTQYVYSIEPDSITSTPVRIQYTNEAGIVVTDDDIIMSDTNVKETFTMSIYSGGLTQTEIKAVLSGENEGQTITANISLVDGELEIRSTTGEEYSSQVGGDNDDPSKITADANDGTKFFVNETQVELTEDELTRVHLLVDDVSDSEEFNTAMGVDAISEAPADVSLTNARYVLAYMDLVDSGNGNAVITMNEGGSVKVYWPVPADAAADSEFYIVHYTGLDRDSVITADALDNAAKDIISGDEIKVENGYITFNVSSFSPFALVYEQKSADAPDVEVTKTVSDRTPEVGDTIRYTVTVTNTGNTVLNNVTVTDTMWENGTVIYVDGQRQVLTGDEYSIDSIAVGSSVVITYYYSVTRSDANDEITNHVEVTVPDGPSDETETTIDVDPYMPNIPDPDDDPDPVEPDFDFVPNWLNTTDHFAYIVGYEDGTIRPTNNITRAEVATIFFRLLTDDAREEFWSQTNDYTDVAADAWYNNAVSTLSNMGIIDGYEDGTFKPNAPITRAEFTAIATRFFDYTAEYEGAFNDVTYSDWYADCVQAAVDMGLVNGYADGGFHPNAYITRAESCAIVNRVLNRVPHEDYLLDEDEMITWPDNRYGAWYYADMQEATNSHDYDWISMSGEVVEEWTDKLAERDWEALEQQWSTAYSG